MEQLQAIGSIIPFKSNAMIAQEREKARLDAAPPKPAYLDNIAVYIDQCMTAAKAAKYPVEEQMLRNQRMRNGTYENEKLAAIRAMGDGVGGSEVYVMLTATKCRAARSWVSDILNIASGDLFTIEPTPLPDLPPEIAQEIMREGMQIFDEVMRQAREFGEQIAASEAMDEVREYVSSRKEETIKEAQEEAAKRAERMMRKMKDVMAESNFAKALSEVVDDMITFKAGVLKGPVIRNKKKSVWKQQPDGSFGVSGEITQCIEFTRVSPFDLYPAPDSRHPDDGYLIERQKLKRSDLVAMLGVPGYSDTNIRLALADYARGRSEAYSSDVQRAEVEFSGDTQHLYSTEKIDALEFWGSVPGKMLIDWGMEGEIDPIMEYEITAIKVGSHVIRAVLNPDKLGVKPYSVDSYERVPGSFWGKGVPELMTDNQDVCNAIARAVVNNAALASGPMVEINEDRVNQQFTVGPWATIKSNNALMQESPAVNFYQPQVIVGPLLQAFDFFATQTEDQTGIPRWAYGNSNIGGAGSTSSGLSMLMTSASRGMKEFVTHIDTVTTSAAERLYSYLMAYDPDPDIKGDCRIMAKGTAGLMAKEQQAIRNREALALTNNPVDMQIIGVEGRAKMLRNTFLHMDMPEVDEIVPEGDDLKALVAKIAAAQQQMLMAQQAGGASPAGGSQPGSAMVPPAAPQVLDPAGNPAGNPDGNAFQSPVGITPGG